MRRHALHVLVVDDDIGVCQLLKLILCDMGHGVVILHDGKDAIELFQSGVQNFDVVITDHNMPQICGLKLVCYLRKNHFPGKIIVVSGSLTKALEFAYQTEKVNKILQKPFSRKEMSFALEELFERWKAEPNERPEQQNEEVK